MLDFQKLIPQIVAICEESQPESDKESQKLSLAQASYEEAGASHEQFLRLLKENGANTFWPTSIPLEAFASSSLIAAFEGSHSVVACDGSQIMPTQHEVHSCYLLNVGAAVFHYGEKSRALLTSFPQLYHRSEDLYPLINQRRVHIDENIVSFERSLKELQVARELALKEQENGNQVLTLVDGSLIPFNVSRNADKVQNDLIERYGIELDAFNAAQLPLIGYISHSRSSDIVNVLRVWRCPYADSKCQMHCGNLDEEDFPCSEIWPLSDRQLMYSKIQKNARSAFFHSSAHWSTSMQVRNWICFAYLNTGQEAARIEIPQWLFEDKKLLEFSLSALLLQIKKGHGYPITLSEAHNMAVIRQADRSRFFQLLGQQLMQGRQQRVELSPKESKKRRGIV